MLLTSSKTMKWAIDILKDIKKGIIKLENRMLSKFPFSVLTQMILYNLGIYQLKTKKYILSFKNLL